MKNVLRILIVLQFMALTAYSQTDIDSVVVITKTIAIEIAKDLERLDASDSTITSLELELDLRVRALGIQDRVIEGLKTNILNLNKIIKSKNDVITVNSEEVNHWIKKYKKEKRQKIIVGGIAIVAVVLALLGG